MKGLTVLVLLLAAVQVSTAWKKIPVSSLPQDDLGVVKAHLQPLQDLCKKNDLYMILRITDKTSLVKVEAGAFATKSMDVHSKSSNWGPMEGFVPVDAFFNKNSRVPENGDGGKYTDILTDEAMRKKCEHEVEHSRELDRENEELKQTQFMTQLGVVQMFLTESGVEALKSKQAPKNTKACEVCKGLCIIDKPKAAPEAQDAFCMSDVADPLPTNAPDWLSIPKPDGNVKFAQYITPEGTTYPVYVWAYKGAPVTGDYDLWAVAPRVTKGTAVDMVKKWVKIEEKMMAGGKTWCSDGLRDFIQEANAALDRSERTVFNHGAEAQNYGFTQYLDDKLLVIPPVGEPFQIASGVTKVGSHATSNLADFLAAIFHQGYLVLHNGMYEMPTGEIPTFRNFKTPEIEMLAKPNELKDLLSPVREQKMFPGSPQQKTIHQFFRALNARTNPKFLTQSTVDFIKAGTMSPHAYAGLFRIAQLSSQHTAEAIFLKIAMQTVRDKYSTKLVKFFSEDEKLNKLYKTSHGEKDDMTFENIVHWILKLLLEPSEANSQMYHDITVAFTPEMEKEVPLSLPMLYGQMEARYARHAALRRSTDKKIERLAAAINNELPDGGSIPEVTGEDVGLDFDYAAASKNAVGEGDSVADVEDEPPVVSNFVKRIEAKMQEHRLELEKQKTQKGAARLRQQK